MLRKSWSHPIPLERGSGRPPWGEASFSWRSGAPHPSCAVCAQRIHAQHRVFEASLASRFRSGGYGRGCQQSDDRKGQLKVLALCTQVTNSRTQGTPAALTLPGQTLGVLPAHTCAARHAVCYFAVRTAPHRTPCRFAQPHSATAYVFENGIASRMPAILADEVRNAHSNKIVPPTLRALPLRPLRECGETRAIAAPSSLVANARIASSCKAYKAPYNAHHTTLTCSANYHTPHNAHRTAYLAGALCASMGWAGCSRTFRN